jgi:phosphoglycolate phosphatase
MDSPRDRRPRARGEAGRAIGGGRSGHRYRVRVIRRLLLFDVDGTLVHTGGVGAAIFDAALESVVGRRPAARIRMSGKTDPQIVAEYLRQMGLPGGSDLVGAVLDVAAQELAAAAVRGELAAGSSVCPGVETLLSVLAGDPRVVSTLVTGNIAPNALIKIGAYGLERWLDLPIGAYGSDAADRNLLVPIALGRLQAVRGVHLEPPDAWVIGDTPRDLECARAAGVRCLLVATGRYDLAALTSLGADALLFDLSDTDAVVSLLTSDLAECP